ncbi:MAG TPA: ABC transporter substrate-binding protein [Burkholderiales bacterium]|nr:ABC transporter substrate-binding protein [Burkholderiales bacterium]
MTRRLLLLALALNLALSAFAAGAEQPAPPRRIGVLLVGWLPEQKEVQEFRNGLLDAGYVEGRDLVIEWRSAAGDYQKIPQLLADLIQHRVDVIVVDGAPAALAAARATSTIPIVMGPVADPLGSGLVTNLAHPGGNITGPSLMLDELIKKRLQLLKELVPRATKVTVLWNPDTPFHKKAIEDLKAAAPSLSIELKFVGVRIPKELDPAFSAASRSHAEALYVIGDTFFFANRGTLVKLASRARLPVIYGTREFASEGGLMSYGPNFGDVFRRSARYVDSILKGAKPGDLPIEQPTKFELVVNLKAAKALGITVPESILLQADEVIR